MFVKLDFLHHFVAAKSENSTFKQKKSKIWEQNFKKNFLAYFLQNTCVHVGWLRSFISVFLSISFTAAALNYLDHANTILPIPAMSQLN